MEREGGSKKRMKFEPKEDKEEMCRERESMKRKEK